MMKTENNEPMFSKTIIMGELKKKNYCFAKGIYEASDPTPIPLEKQKISCLADYLDSHYRAGTKPKNSEQILRKIFDNKTLENIIQADKSEYLKILALCAILTSLKKGWYNLLVYLDENSPKLSVEANWTYKKSSAIKIKHDEIINCFYSQLICGLSDNKNNFTKESFTYNSNNKQPTKEVLFKGIQSIEESIYKLFNFYEKQQRSISQSKRSEDTISFADETSRDILNTILKRCLNIGDLINDFQDGLRLSLIKFAALNQMTNNINAELRLHKEVKESFPKKKVFTLIETFRDSNESLNYDKIIKSIEDIYRPDKGIKYTPKDLIECAKFIYILYSLVSTKKLDMRHPAIEYIGLAALLIYDDFICCSKVDLGVQGETNRHILIYKGLSDFLKTTPVDRINELSKIESIIPNKIGFYFLLRYELTLALFHNDEIEYLDKNLDLKSHYARAKVVKDTLKLLKEYNSEILINFAIDLSNTVNETVNEII